LTKPENNSIEFSNDHKIIVKKIFIHKNFLGKQVVDEENEINFLLDESENEVTRRCSAA